MKTTIDLDRMSAATAASAASTWPPLIRPRRPAISRGTIRLALVLSVAAALAAVLLRAVLGVPTLVILAMVIVVGAVLSWRSAGQHGERRDA